MVTKIDIKMQMRNQCYTPLAKNQYYIDKTNTLEKGIAEFPSIYMEGAAACGKTTAMKMLLEKHPEVSPFVIWMDEELKKPSKLLEKLEQIKENAYQADAAWMIFENFHALEQCADSNIRTQIITAIAAWIFHLPENQRIVLISREKPAAELLELFWKRKMEIFSQETFLFTKEEIRKFAEYTETMLNPEEIYAEIGGWAGCVDVLIRLSGKFTETFEKKSGKFPEMKTVKALLNCYEMDQYIQKQILQTLSAQERELMYRGMLCPWINETLCREVWEIHDAGEPLEDLNRKGMFLCDSEKGRWKLSPLFQHSCAGFWQKEQNLRQTSVLWEKTGEWYGKHGFVKEALQCLKQADDQEAYRSCLLEFFDQISFLEIPYDEVMTWKENSPEICYLRGMYGYFGRNLEGIDREIKKLEKMAAGDWKNDGKVKEILLNLYFAKPDFPLNKWLDLLEQYGQEQQAQAIHKNRKNGLEKETIPQKLRLYEILGNSCTYLCGLRDLSGLFACTKKEENRRAKIWKEYLGDEEWKCYQLARFDYYLETERSDSIRNEDWELLRQNETASSWKSRLVRLYLFHKIQKIQPEEENQNYIHHLEQALEREENPVCIRNTEAIRGLYAFWLGEQEKMTRWLRDCSMDSNVEISEKNHIALCCQAKGDLLLNQYEKAEKILQRLIPWLQFYHRSIFYAECLFGQAAANWGNNRQAQALRSVIESFLISSNYRYVGFYTHYGKNGKEVLEFYMEWMQKNTLQTWHRKKKYNYGNVLRMPTEDYLEVILRQARRENRAYPGVREQDAKERLTMTETIVLQNINRGMSNEEIGKELNLKLTTVKSHIYSIYKKLGVNSRVQAILKGKELGVLD